MNMNIYLSKSDSLIRQIGSDLVAKIITTFSFYNSLTSFPTFHNSLKTLKSSFSYTNNVHGEGELRISAGFRFAYALNSVQRTLSFLIALDGKQALSVLNVYHSSGQNQLSSLRIHTAKITSIKS